MAPARKKRRRVYACAGCAAELDVQETPDEVTFCEDCAERVEAADMHWFVAHVDPTFVCGSSNDALVAPSQAPLGPATVEGRASTEAARGWLREADAVLVLAGAGMSRDSGLPDFRGDDGWYVVEGRRVSMEHMDFHIHSKHWDGAWRTLSAMATAFRAATPHAGYAALRGLVAGKRAFVVTSNIDGLFERSGFSAVYEVHGSALRLQCSSVGEPDDCRAGVWDVDAAALRALRRRYAGAEGADEAVPLPRCDRCGRHARPNMSHATDCDEEICEAVKGPQRTRMREWLEAERKQKSALVVLEVGCGTSVHGLRRDSELVVAAQRSAGGTASLIRVDPGDSRVPDGPRLVGVSLGAQDALAALARGTGG